MCHMEPITGSFASHEGEPRLVKCRTSLNGSMNSDLKEPKAYYFQCEIFH